MQSWTRKPDFHIEIKRPNYNITVYSPSIAQTIGLFGPEKTRDQAFIRYEFKETIQVTDCTFNLTFTAEADDDKLTWFDKIHVMDVVSIYELGKIKFAGVVTDRRYSSRMTDEGVARTISISGLSAANLLSKFNLIFDLYLYDSDTFAEAENVKLKASLATKMKPGLSVASILEQIYNSFFDLALKMGTTNKLGVGIKALVNYFVDFGSDLSEDVVIRYPIALSIFNPGENNIWSILTSLVTPPINELFPKLDDSDGKYHVIYRQAPFDADDWRRLPLNKISPLFMTQCDFGSSDSEVYTYYLTVIAGSGISEKKALLLEATGVGAYAERDEEKWKKYGYRPLIIELKYFDKDYYDTSADVASVMHSLALMLRTWFEHNDEFLSGSIEFMTMYSREPRIGERLQFLDGEFYIESSEHSWSYGDAMVTRLGVSRGYVYTGGGALSKPIADPGRKIDAYLRRKVGEKVERYSTQQVRS